MLSLLPLLLQVTPVAPIIKGTALPPPDADTAAVLAPVERMFAGLAAHDAQAIRAELRPEGGATVAIEQPRSEKHTSELQSLLRRSYAVLCLKNKKYNISKKYNACTNSMRA